MVGCRPVAEGYLLRIAGVDDRDAAAALTLGEVRVARSSLPPLAPGEYYVEDVIGCAVEDEAGARSASRSEPSGTAPTTWSRWRAATRPRAAHPAGPGLRADRRRPPAVRSGSAGTTRRDRAEQEQARDETTAPALTFEVVTLFPEVMAGFLSATVIGRAIAAGVVAVHRTNPRDFAPGRHRQVDDTPYGGGPGMILRVEPIAAALDAVATARGPSRRILLTPRGALFDQARARALAAETRLTLVCGRYEGVDERVAGLCRRGAAPRRLRPGRRRGGGGGGRSRRSRASSPACSAAACRPSDESFSAGRLEYPQWTRPATWRGQAVPEVLLSGDHQAIAALAAPRGVEGDRRPPARPPRGASAQRRGTTPCRAPCDRRHPATILATTLDSRRRAV